MISNPVLIQNITNVTNQTFTDATMAGAQWEFQSLIGGGCQPGKFLTDNTETNLTSRICISGINAAGTDSSYILNVGVGNFIRFTDAQGGTVVFLLVSVQPSHDEEGCIEMGVQCQGGVTPWLGRYVVDFQPGTGA